MSPILVRPVREQLEHDRVIRLLQAKYKRKFEVAINPGNEQTMPVGDGPSPWYPDLVLQTSDRTRKLAAVVEVETVESVNNLEAMSQWVTFGRLRVPFHLYLPTQSIDTGRRFCTELEIPVAELWAYQAVGDQIRFTLVHRTGPPLEGKPSRSVSESTPAEPARRPAARAESEPPPARAAKTPARPNPAPARPVTPARPAANPRPAASATRARASNPPAAAPARRGAAAAAATPRRPAAKAKAVPPPRRAAAAKAAPPRRKAKAAPASRAQKRR